MEDPRLIQEFLERLTPETRLGVLKQTDEFGNTGLHEAAVVENYDVARILVDLSRKSGDAYKGLVETKNRLGETPVYRAAALGKTKVLQMLTEQVGDLRCHFDREKDDMTILHMAVLSQHFETAIWLLNHDSSLAEKRARLKYSSKPNKLNRLTCLELLALMPTAFKSTDDMKKMRSPFHYRTWIYCLMSAFSWKSVKEIMPRHYAMHRDKEKNITASDLFDLTHEDQLRKAQEWIKETAQACSILAILIATVVFTAAFTVPGGNNDRGFPNFLTSPLFYVFTVTDVASLSLSLSSVVMFLSILTSPRESSDFLSNLPFKLTTGFILLFFSVLTSMITFSASLLLIIRLRKKWTATLYAAAIFPVVVLALMVFPVYANFAANFKDYWGPSKKKKRAHWR
ncbi:hypothetical protein CUMW_244860 [Citrus unshiu]|uniref:PGG domain-containing protein n=1 Tax=Citrus unshiu TaxID=55188 RepID=A0A2H5QMT3_CITUN|nr:hypothetical protein CUMW_244860 [Citrus unshiu]